LEEIKLVESWLEPRKAEIKLKSWTTKTRVITFESIMINLKLSRSH
jgi:hypothetical protein